MEKKSHDIYISYTRNDKDACDKITQVLKNNGFSVWSEADLISGMLYADALQDAILKSKVIIAICSTWSLNSVWMKNELAFAQEKGIPVIKILTDNPNGLEGTRRMNFGSLLELGCNRFEEKLLSMILNYGIKSNSVEIYSDAIALYKKAIALHDVHIEKTAFLKMLRAAELGNKEAKSCVECQAWNIDLKDTVSLYKSINSYFVKDLLDELYERGEIITDDETLTDNSQRGRGMERVSFRFMKRAIDLGYTGGSPLNYNWCFLEENDFEECLNQLGLSSRIHLNEERINKISNENVEREHQIFISYKRDDSDMVFPIKDKIELNTGKKCWIDLDGIESDDQFVNVIIKAINKADVFLFMYSHSHTAITDYKKDWTVREISFAQKRNKRIVFVNIDNTDLTDWFEMMLGLQQQVDATSNSAMERLYRDLKKWLGDNQKPIKNNVIPKKESRISSFDKGISYPTTDKEADDVKVNIKDNIGSNDILTVKLNNIQFNMIRVEGGTLEIGATQEQLPDAEGNEYPSHSITLPTYYIGQFPVTQNLWEKVMGYNHSYNQQSEKELVSEMERKKVQVAIMNALKPIATPTDIMESDYGHYPVENIAYNEAKQFVNRLSELTNKKFDLPTEEEWEYAARGGQKSHQYRYAGSNRIDDVAWYRHNSSLRTHPVGEKQPNELGIYDMSGNVWEWTKSKAHQYDVEVGPENKLFIRRGGSVIHVEKNCRVSFRYETERSKHNMGSGLRVVLRENIDKE